MIIMEINMGSSVKSIDPPSTTRFATTRFVTLACSAFTAIYSKRDE